MTEKSNKFINFIYIYIKFIKHCRKLIQSYRKKEENDRNIFIRRNSFREFRSSQCYLYCTKDFKTLEIWSYNGVWKWIRKNGCFANVRVFETHTLNVYSTKVRIPEGIHEPEFFHFSSPFVPPSRLLSFMSTLLRFASSYSLRRLHSGMWLFHSVAILLPPTYLLRSQSYATIPLWCKKRLVKFTRLQRSPI